MKRFPFPPPIGLLLIAVCFVMTSLQPAHAARIDDFLGMVQSQDPEVRNQARDQIALQVGAEAIVPLLDLVGGDQPAARRCADEAIEKIVHNAFRPGNAEQRQTVVDALAAYLEQPPIRPDIARLKALRMLGLGGNADQIPLLAGLLADAEHPVIQDAARRCMERIGGPEAVRAMAHALQQLEEPMKIGVLQSLGSLTPYPELGDELYNFAMAESLPVRIETCETMAEWGDKRALRLIGDTRRYSFVSNHPEIADALDAANLRILQNVDDPRNRTALVFRLVRTPSVGDHIRLSGLNTLIEIAPANFSSMLIVLLDDSSPVISGFAADYLIDMQDPNLNQALVDLFDIGENPRKAAILSVLVAREAPEFNALLEKVVEEEDAPLYTIAVDLADLPHTREALDVPRLELAMRNGDEQVQALAADMLIDIAEELATRVENNQPVWILRNVLRFAPNLETRARALEAVGTVGHPEGIELVEPFLSDPDTGRQASSAYIQLARGLIEGDDREEGVQMLSFLAAGSTYAEIVEQAAATLQQLGVDTSEFAVQAGFITRWWVLGPFAASDTPEILDFPEGPIQIEELYQVAGRPRRWQPISSTLLPAVFNLAARFTPKENVAAYAFCNLEFAEPTDAILKLGSDDGVLAWLNGTLVHNNPASRSLQVDQDQVPVQFKQGTNQLLLKITQGGVDWAFCARLTASDGSPLPAELWKVE
ncbi:MAG: HEAT repeat domain-containing protein [Verrucomicrobiota bacterium]